VIVNFHLVACWAQVTSLQHNMHNTTGKAKFSIPESEHNTAKLKHGQGHCTRKLTLILLTWRMWWARNNASKWQVGFNLAFKGLKPLPWEYWSIPIYRTVLLALWCRPKKMQGAPSKRTTIIKYGLHQQLPQFTKFCLLLYICCYLEFSRTN